MTLESLACFLRVRFRAWTMERKHSIIESARWTYCLVLLSFRGRVEFLLEWLPIIMTEILNSLPLEAKHDLMAKFGHLAICGSEGVTSTLGLRRCVNSFLFPLSLLLTGMLVQG